MNNIDLLHATRDICVLIEKPNTDESGSKHFWSVQLGGLHQQHLRDAADQLRKEHLHRADSRSKKRALKSVGLLNALAYTLGAKSYDHWHEEEQHKIADFLSEHGMSQPKDLIAWPYAPGLAGALTAQQVADRLFNSGLPLPKRIFTGVGSFLFSPLGYGRLDIDQLAGCIFWSDEQRYSFCEKHTDQVLLRAVHMADKHCPAYIDLTGRMLMLNAATEFIAGMYNMMGSNLMDPSVGPPVIRSYDTSESSEAYQLKLFKLFREEIESSDDGWVDVIPVPGNSNLIFLRGANGAFDWVVRDQRDNRFSSNPYYPFFEKKDLPKAMDESKLKGNLYFSTGEWAEKLEHDAEARHYSEGGTAASWPGYEKLIQRELFASKGYQMPRPETGSASDGFVPHRGNKYCLMVSSLVTISEFLEFQERVGWSKLRETKALRAGRKIESLEGNNTDSDCLPVSVTWLDAVAYCRDYERRTGLPVRLMTIEEWRDIAPLPWFDFDRVWVKSDEIAHGPTYELQEWGIIGGDGKLGGLSAHCHGPGTMEFTQSLKWITSNEGIQFLSVPGFGEWLGDYQDGAAPAACAATHESIIRGPIERALCPASMTMRYKGVKIGFRLCYVYHLDT